MALFTLAFLNPMGGNKLMLDINGIEKASWLEHIGRSSVRHEQTIKVLDRKLPIYTFSDRMVTPGQYTFPFSFRLPSYLAGSVDSSVGSIACSIEAKREPTNAKRLKPISFSLPVIVVEPLEKTIKQKTVKKSTELLCCDCSRGEQFIKFTIDKNAYMPKETVQAQIEVDNSRCKLNVSRIKCQLKQYTVVRANNARKMFDFIIMSNQITRTIKAGEKVAGKDAINIELKLSHEKISTADRGIALSTNGKAIKVWYSIEAVLVMSGCVPELDQRILSLCAFRKSVCNP